MKIAKTVTSMRRALRGCPAPVVLVPTMGALHPGHEALIRRARRQAGREGTVVVSIFVNPTQFGPGEDFSRYPRSPKRDLEKSRRAGADLVFLPAAEAMFAEDSSLRIEESLLSRALCGASRPGHFTGVCTVVAKLFLIIQPQVAVFGEKDWQQLAILRRMVRELNFPVRIVGQATVRERDGLAASSRNLLLSRAERALAPKFHAALKLAAREKSRSAILRVARRALERVPGLRIDYLELVDAETLESDARTVNQAARRKRPLRLAGAVFLGQARLIDNLAVSLRP